MRPRLTIAREIGLTVIAAFVLVPAVKAPARQPVATAPAGSYSRVTPGLANPNPRLRPKPLKTWVCLSSWYGGDFDGQVTADGEIYDMYGQTAAHPSLPLGSVVRVINLRTKKSVIVRINDRGPYVQGRDLDVSYGVARELGFVRRGTARVRVELLRVPASKTSRSGKSSAF